MKTLINLLTIWVVLFILFTGITSCTEKEKRIEQKFLAESIHKLNVSNSFKWFVILPGLGCHGCIQEGEAFMKEYVSNPDILFVLTKISSLKILQHKINIDISDYTNIYIDRENIFSIPTNNAIYPCIVRLKNGEIGSFEFQCPGNSMAFLKLKNQIETN